MAHQLTRVHLHYGANRFNHYLRFGAAIHRDSFGKHQAYGYFYSGAVFCYIRWQANQYGTKSWQVFVLQAADSATKICKISGIEPGAIVLLALTGTTRVHHFFAVLDRIKANKIDPCDVAPWYWTQTNARINSSIAPLTYTKKQHTTWLLERAVLANSLTKNEVI